MNENKKTIKGFSDYEMYEDGRIWSKKWNRFMRPTLIKHNDKKYYIIHLIDDEGKKKMCYIHKMKRELFGVKVPELDGLKHKVIEGYENYSIYSNGIVYSHKRNIFLKYVIVNDKKYVVLVKDKQTHSLSVAKLVARAFIKGYNDDGFIIFKDRDYFNCDVSNLEFRSNKHIKVKN